MKNFIEKRAKIMRQAIIKSDGTVDMFAANIRVMVPTAMAIACWFLLSPDDWNVSEDIRTLMSSLWWAAAAGILLNTFVAVVTLLIIKVAIDDSEG